MSAASQSERLAFGPNLRRARLRRGVSLESISSVTNVPVALWEGFEDNDLSAWPPGVLARTFVAQYAHAVSEITGRSMGRWTVKRAAASSFWLRSEKA